MKLWIMAVVASLIALAVVLVLIFGTYTRRSQVGGQLVPVSGMAAVLASTSGVITSLDIQEGDRVEAGQVIGVLAVPRATMADGNTSAALGARLQRRVDGLRSAQDAKQDLLEAQRTGLAAQLNNARLEYNQIGAEIATRREQVRIANETLLRLQSLEEERFVSLLQIKQQESLALSHLSELQALERQSILTERMIGQISQAIRELPSEIRAAEASFEQSAAAIEQELVENIASSELAIVAPVSGIVATLQVKAGQSVQGGQSMISLLPGDGELEAELLIPSRAIGFVEEGDKVLLRYQAFPFQKFGHHEGSVTRISRSTLHLGRAESATEPFYRITVALREQSVSAYGRKESLKPGMLVDADVLGESRSLFEWVLEPIYSIKGTVFGE
ncbi:HlyD family secretion protein [Luteimonas sp. WGS1318]|uniref:HlyD family secretion protein n=1 Tax=Luteimonas sp. WGS1318 TaxID=3366815 RepID=UPI00372D7F0C